MTPERMRFVMEAGFRDLRRNGAPAHLEHCARFLGVQPVTLRRWMRGERPIPRQVEIIMEIFHHWPEIRLQAVDKLLRARDEASRS